MHDIFISHSTKDKDFAFQITKKLEDNGLKVWIAPRNIQSGHIYAYDIVEAITDTRLFLILVSENSLVSDDVERELLLAAEEKKQIIPAYLDNSYEMKTFNKPSFRYYLVGIQRLVIDMKNSQDSLNKITHMIFTELQNEVKKEFRNEPRNSEYNSEYASMVKESIADGYGVKESKSIAKNNYWIFQGDQADTYTMYRLKNNRCIDWIVLNHKNDIQIEDKVLIWMNGSNSFCYANCRITSEVYKINSFLDNDEVRYGVDIEILNNLIDYPISIEGVHKHKELNKLLTGIPGACYRIEEKQFEEFYRILHSL